MKPRTKLQRRVVELSNNLHNENTKMQNWAAEKLVPKFAFATKRKVECLECGNSFSPDEVKRKRATCPHCQAKVKVVVTRDRKCDTQMYLALADTGYYDDVSGEEFQLVRYFDFRAYYKVGCTPRFWIQEVLQHWILPNRKYETIARLLHSYGNFLNTDMEIRKDGYWKKYDICAHQFHPCSEFKDMYKKYGIDAELKGMSFIDAIRTVPNNNKAETLLKLKHWQLFSYCDDICIHTSWPSILIAIKHKYKFEDVKIWFDYIELLKHYGKDIRNPHYICPKNLKKEHDKWVMKKRKDDEVLQRQREYVRALKDLGEYDAATFVLPKNWMRELPTLRSRLKVLELERKQKELEQRDIEYRNFIQPFLNLNISAKNIKIVALRSIDEFKAEGEILNHCVYANEYFKKENCLILSALVDGTKTETIEVNLEQMKVVQCRGARNMNTEHHDAILALMKRNMRQIAKQAKKSEKVKELETA